MVNILYIAHIKRKRSVRIRLADSNALSLRDFDFHFGYMLFSVYCFKLNSTITWEWFCMNEFTVQDFFWDSIGKSSATGFTFFMYEMFTVVAFWASVCGHFIIPPCVSPDVIHKYIHGFPACGTLPFIKSCMKFF